MFVEVWDSFVPCVLICIALWGLFQGTRNVSQGPSLLLGVKETNSKCVASFLLAESHLRCSVCGGHFPSYPDRINHSIEHHTNKCKIVTLVSKTLVKWCLLLTVFKIAMLICSYYKLPQTNERTTSPLCAMHPPRDLQNHIGERCVLFYWFYKSSFF